MQGFFHYRRIVFTNKTIERGCHANLALSDITITEYSVFPYKNNRTDLICALNKFIDKSKADVLHTTRKVADKVAKIRAEYPFFKTMDALQLAFASVNECDLFLTNDKQLRQFKELNCVTVEEFEIK